MAGFNLSPPDPFLAVPGEPAVPWGRWLTGFDAYIVAMGFTDEQMPDKRKLALLTHCLGTEGQRILGALGSPTGFSAAVALLTEHFTGTQRVLIRRYKLRKRHQRPGESIQAFVADLRDLARHCDYGALQDEMIRDQMIEGTSCEKTREKLLMEPDHLSLADAIKTALQVESALEYSSLLNTTESACKQLTSTHHVTPESFAAAGTDIAMLQKVRQRPQVRQRSQVGARSNCANCGSFSHVTRASDCPARGQTCRNCGKLNHYAKVCRSATSKATSRNSTWTGQYSTDCADVSNVLSGSAAFKTCTVQLGEVSIPLLVDTGAAASLLNQATYKMFFSHIPLGPRPRLSLRGYGNSKIDVVGTINLPVSYGKKHLSSFSFTVACQGANLLGLDLFLDLGFSLMDNSGQAIMQVLPMTLQNKCPMLFEGLGCVTAFTHRPRVDPNVAPVIQPLRRVPLALRDGVSAEMSSLLEEGIIEPIDASPWVSNLVIARKKTGGLRMCVDLRQVNKAIIPDKYPLPTVEELTALFHGSTVFSKLDLRQGYLQIPLHPASRDLTAFVTHAGVFRYTRMPFGLSSAPSCFQKVMSTILAGLPGTAVYLDDSSPRAGPGHP